MGTRLGTDLARVGGVLLYGGANWNTTDRLGSAAGAGYRGNAAGFTVAQLLRIDAQVNGAFIDDMLDGTGKGWDVRQDTATSIVWRVANAAGTGWNVSAPYAPAADIGKVIMLVLVYTGPGGVIQHWANDEKVGADVAADGYVLPSAALRETIGCRQNGSFAHSGMVWSGRGGWDRAFAPEEVHALYDIVAALGRIPTGLVGQASVVSVAADVSGASFPATLRNLVTPGTGDLTFFTGSAAGISLVRFA